MAMKLNDMAMDDFTIHYETSTNMIRSGVVD